MRATFVRASAVAVFAAASAIAIPARAGFDADAAGAALERARATHHYTFCEKPRVPLSSRAQLLCGHASEVASCAGFAEACASNASIPQQCRVQSSKAEEESPSLDRWAWASVLGQIARLLVWALLLALVVFAVVHLIGSRRKARRDRHLADDLPEPQATATGEAETPAMATLDEEGMLARAEKHALAGEYALALQLYLGAALRSLDRRGAVRLGRDRTNGEYVRSCADPELRPILRDIVREVERVQFGREHPTAERVTMTGRRAVAIVRSLSVALFVIALVAVGGCSANPCFAPEVAGDDPAGDELFRDVLEGQGYRVGRLARSLASLGEPEWWRTSSTAVVIDTDVVGVDPETWEHLATWVTSGGVLVLAGSPVEWPHVFGVEATHATAGPLGVVIPPAPGADPDDEPRRLDTGNVVRSGALTLPDEAGPVAWVGDAAPYAAWIPRGTGSILVLATDELLTNAGLSRRGNAAAMTAVLAHVNRTEFLVAEQDDGVSPPSSPVSSLLRAGLGLGLVHALIAAAILFFAAGVRLARPRHASPPARRAFAEHVRAVGGLYERTSNAAHALAAYTRFAEERLRTRMPRGAVDVPTFLAQRTSQPLGECQELWNRALASRAGNPARGDELAVLKRLSATCTAAIGPGPSRPVESEGS